MLLHTTKGNNVSIANRYKGIDPYTISSKKKKALGHVTDIAFQNDHNIRK